MIKDRGRGSFLPHTSEQQKWLRRCSAAICDAVDT